MGNLPSQIVKCWRYGPNVFNSQLFCSCWNSNL